MSFPYSVFAMTIIPGFTPTLLCLLFHFLHGGRYRSLHMFLRIGLT